jgi:hypothetical protein
MTDYKRLAKPIPVTLATGNTFTYTMTGTPTAHASGADLIATTPGTTQSGSISRVTAVMDHAGTSGGVSIESYTYLGLDTIDYGDGDRLRRRGQVQYSLSRHCNSLVLSDKFYHFAGFHYNNCRKSAYN